MPRHRVPTWTVLLLLATSGGCLHPLWKHDRPVEYHTVAATSQGDEETAAAKHAEALVFIEDYRWPKDLVKAELLLNEALVADVGYGPAHNSLGMVYYMQDKLYLAAWEFQYAAKLMPDHPQPYNNLGLVYERAGKYEEATSYFSMALSRDAGRPEVLANLVRVRMIQGEKSGDLKHMISDLALHHPDPQWQQWARDKVELGKFDAGASGLAEPKYFGEPPEALPSPIRDPQIMPHPAGDADLEFPDAVGVKANAA
ncbi:MAG: hypothetical protein KDA44_05230 [Planctomycetales bacterium]|nr:hypothetical protein [Planctomycetales bacterium]